MPFDVNEVVTKLRSLRRGDALVYYRGDLVSDCDKWMSGMRDDLKLVRAIAWSLYQSGAIALAQRKIKDQDYEYIAQGK